MQAVGTDIADVVDYLEAHPEEKAALVQAVKMEIAKVPKKDTPYVSAGIGILSIVLGLVLVLTGHPVEAAEASSILGSFGVAMVWHKL